MAFLIDTQNDAARPVLFVFILLRTLKVAAASAALWLRVSA
jgi:hypothetical protein